MRNLWAAIAVVAAAAAVALPGRAAGAPRVSGGAEQEPVPRWIGPGRTRRFFVVSAVRFVDPLPGVRTRALIARGSCFRARGMVALCSFAGRVYQVAAADTEFDPLLRTARIT